VARASAAADLGIGAGGAVVLGPAGDDPGVTTRVALGGRSASDDPEGT